MAISILNFIISVVFGSKICTDFMLSNIGAGIVDVIHYLLYLAFICVLASEGVNFSWGKGIK